MIPTIIFLITAFTGLLTVGLIIKNYKMNSLVNVYIIIIIIAFSVCYFLIGLASFTTDETLKSSYLRYSNVAVLVVPLFYLYFKNLFKNDKTVKKTALLHFIFPISFFVFMINLDFLEINNKVTYIVLFAIFISYVIYYSFLCYLVIRKNVWQKKGTDKVALKQSTVKTNWILFLFFAMLVLAFRLLGSLYFELNFGSTIKHYSFQWIAALIWLLVLFKLIVSPELIYGYTALQKKLDENRTANLHLHLIWETKPKIPMKNAQHQLLKEKIEPNIISYIEKIEKITITGRIFRDSFTTMNDLANKINIPKSHISYLFKYHSTISFSEYKKVVRIQDAIQLINDDYLNETTLDHLSKTVGFPSYNTFFTSFKEISGTSPVDYCKARKR